MKVTPTPLRWAQPLVSDVVTAARREPGGPHERTQAIGSRSITGALPRRGARGVARKARAAQGLGPSKFDSILGMGSNLAGAVSGGGGDSGGIGGGNVMDMIKNLAPQAQAAEAPSVSQNRPSLTTPQYGMETSGTGSTGGASAPQSGAALGPSDNFVQQLAGSTKARMDQAAMSRPKPQMRKKSFQYA